MSETSADDIHFADGFDVADRLALGLGAPQLVAVVTAGLAGYALLQAPLPAMVAMPLTLLLVASGAALGWLRIAGRPALDWTLLAARFAASSHRGSLLSVSSAATESPSATATPAPHATAAAAPTPSAVIPLRPSLLPVRPSPAVAGDPPSPHRRRRAGAHRITFFSLKGGTGRTALATELASGLALAAPRRKVGLLDLDLGAASVGARLGLQGPSIVDFALAAPDERRALDHLTRHHSGLQVLLGAQRLPHPEWPVTAAVVRETLRELDLEGFDVVLIDVAAELSPLSDAVLRSVDDVFVVVAPTSSGVHDAYRTTEALRRCGLRYELRYVVNRVRGDTDVSEVMRDLRGRVVAEIPDDVAVTDAENQHRLAGAAPTPAGQALQRFIRRIDRELRWSCED